MKNIFPKLGKVTWILFTVVFVILVGVVSVGVFEFTYADTYYPGVTIAKESVGGKTYDQVLQEFNGKSDTLQNNGLTLVFERKNGKKEIHIPKSTMGLTSDISVEYFSVPDLQSDLSQAYQFGRSASLMQRLKEQFVLLAGKNFNISVSAHPEAIQSLLARETKNLFTAKVPAQFSFDKDGKLIIIPEKVGDNIDLATVFNVAIENLALLQVKPVIFTLQTESPYTTEKKLKPLLALAQQFADFANVTFYYQNHQWKVNGKTLVTWLTLKSGSEMTIDNTKLEAFLSSSVVPLIDDPPQNSRFEIRNGKLVEISPGKSGDVVNMSKTTLQIERIIPHIQQSFIDKGNFIAALFAAALVENNSAIQYDPKDSTINVPIETIQADPLITQKTIDQYGISDLIGSAKTNFTGGSLDRQRNIEVGVSKMTGMLIAPGQEFSTAESIGEITEKAGFVKEYVIEGNQTVKELGGGLCQLATTLFRAALNTGLPITERVNHAYVIPYYGPGLDATIYGPHPDFRFVNDTNNYLLLQGTAKNNEVIFELYGISDGRVAGVSTPVLYDEKPVPPTRNILSADLPLGKTTCATATHKGITADVTYTVSYQDGSKKETIFHSVYQPWPKVCLVGTSF